MKSVLRRNIELLHESIVDRVGDRPELFGVIGRAGE
jgi:hypothetical protein